MIQFHHVSQCGVQSTSLTFARSVSTCILRHSSFHIFERLMGQKNPEGNEYQGMHHNFRTIASDVFPECLWLFSVTGLLGSKGGNDSTHGP